MLHRVYRFWQEVSPGAKAVLLFSISFLIFSWWLGTPFFIDPDGLYHIKISQMQAKGLVTEFPWLYYTPWRESFTDHHYLYHLFLAPFVLWLPAGFGAKLATALIAAAIPTTVYVGLRARGVKAAWLFAFMVATFGPSAFRWALVKAPGMAILFAVVIFFAALYRKTFISFVLAFLFMWAYGGAPVAIPIVGAVFLGEVITKFFKISKDPVSKQALKAVTSSLQVPIATVLGLLAGLVINPYFPANLDFLWEQLVLIAIVNQQSEIGVGVEWYPYDPKAFFSGAASLLAISVGAITFMFMRVKHLSKETISTFILYVFFVIMTFKSRRYIEYLAPFGFMFVGFSLSEAYIAYKAQVHAFVSRAFHPDNKRRGLYIGVVIYFVAFFFLQTGLAITKNRETLAGRGKIDQYQGAGTFLEENAEEGDIVLHSSWDEFPVLFYHTNKVYFINGLDPTFLYHYDEDLYWKWVNVTIGITRLKVGEDIKEFDAEWVFATSHHYEMRRNIESFTDFEKVYEDDEATIYRVK